MQVSIDRRTFTFSAKGCDPGTPHDEKFTLDEEKKERCWKFDHHEGSRVYDGLYPRFTSGENKFYLFTKSKYHTAASVVPQPCDPALSFHDIFTHIVDMHGEKSQIVHFNAEPKGKVRKRRGVKLPTGQCFAHFLPLRQAFRSLKSTELDPLKLYVKILLPNAVPVCRGAKPPDTDSDSGDSSDDEEDTSRTVGYLKPVTPPSGRRYVRGRRNSTSLGSSTLGASSIYKTHSQKNKKNNKK